MQKWEYHVMYLEKSQAESIQDELNQRGREGWELVSVVPHEAQSGWDFLTVFKRPQAAGSKIVGDSRPE